MYVGPCPPQGRPLRKSDLQAVGEAVASPVTQMPREKWMLAIKRLFKRAHTKQDGEAPESALDFGSLLALAPL